MSNTHSKISSIIAGILDDQIPENFAEDLCLSCIADEAAAEIEELVIKQYRGSIRTLKRERKIYKDTNTVLRERINAIHDLVKPVSRKRIIEINDTRKERNEPN
jgi:hypothetical protein